MRTCALFSNSEREAELRLSIDLSLTKKASRRSCVTGRAYLVDFEEQDIPIAIDPGFDQSLGVPGFFALFPDLAAGT